MSIFPDLTAALFSRDLIAKWRRWVRRIDAIEHQLEPITDAELRKKSLSLRYQVLSGKNLDDMLIEAFALVREAARRTIGMRHYDVQLLGGIAMHCKNIIVMQTGEGKTLTATLPIYLNALAGKGVHLATANDYLAERDAELMRPVYESLGLTIGIVTSDAKPDERAAAYRSDITYTTSKEIGFDFLRDRLQKRSTEIGGGRLVESMLTESKGVVDAGGVQREHHFVLIDEADSILIDEARTPLVVSSQPDEIARAKIALYKWCAENSKQSEIGEHYELLDKSKQLRLNTTGRRFVRKLKKPEQLTQTPILDIYDQIELSVYVDRNYVRDRPYIIREGEIVIVDEFTGRLAEGRKWKSGIHQAIEAREDLEVSVETGEAARITIQDLFLRYTRLAGMTGTVGNSNRELKKIYNVGVVEIPTHRPSRRKQWDDNIFATDAQKWEAIVEEVVTVHKTGRPVLIGTRSIDKSEVLSKLLAEKKIDHQVLNARNLPLEAEIVAAAGQLHRVTVATNMAGRGTDIKVDEDALEAGGLHVICTEMHESARIDRQLIGRCGRQGDVGSFRQFMSLEDDLLKVSFGEQQFAKMQRARASTQSLRGHSATFRKAQRKIESRHFEGRKMLMHQENLRRELQIEMGQDPYLDVAGAQ